jgi:hypothetical protein
METIISNPSPWVIHTKLSVVMSLCRPTALLHAIGWTPSCDSARYWIGWVEMNSLRCRSERVDVSWAEEDSAELPMRLRCKLSWTPAGVSHGMQNFRWTQNFPSKRYKTEKTKLKWTQSKSLLKSWSSSGLDTKETVSLTFTHANIWHPWSARWLKTEIRLEHLPISRLCLLKNG